jgi:hypothetical protein
VNNNSENPKGTGFAANLRELSTNANNCRWNARAALVVFLLTHAAAIANAVEALERLRDCDWVITPADRMDAVRKIAGDALAAFEQAKKEGLV